MGRAKSKENSKPVNVYDRNGHKIFRYPRPSRGRLKTCFPEEIRANKTDLDLDNLKLGDVVHCVQCEPALAIGVIILINGGLVLELDQTAVRKVCG